MIAGKVANALALDWPRDRLEVIVACDGSPDDTAARARAAGADRVLELPWGGKIRAQDAAVAEARGDLLAFSDANALWEPDALRALAARFADPARRLRLRPGALRVRRRHESGGAVLALRDGDPRARVGPRLRDRRQRGDLRRPARGLRERRPGHGPRPHAALHARQARVARGLRTGRAGEREDGPDDRGRVRPQAPDDEPHVADRPGRGDALAARLPAALRVS